MLIFPMLFGAFQPLRPHRAARSQIQRPCTDLGMEDDYMKRFTRDYQAPSQQIPLSGFGGRKAPRSMGKTNTPRSFDSAPHKRSVTRSICERSAQDDDFVGVLTKNILDK